VAGNVSFILKSVSILLPLQPPQEYYLFYKNLFARDLNTHTSVPKVQKLFLSNQFTCRTLAVRGVTLLPRQVAAGVAVKKKSQKKKNNAAERQTIRGECVWDVYVHIFYTGDANPVKCSPEWSGQRGRNTICKTFV
jgi:hypothetical protein